jgi:hypothetical protein
MHRSAAILCLLAAIFGLLAPARGAEPTVTASLSQNVAAVGEPLQFHIKVGGARSEPPPPDVAVDGLDVRYLGPSSSTSMRIENGRVTNESHVIHIYSVRPQREGTFQFPAIPVEVDGRQYRTQPLTLKVEKNSGKQAGTPTAPATLEIVLPKTTAYVGEMIPVEIRLSVDSRVRWQPQSMPDFSGDGFTKQKMPEPRQEHGRKDGREMDVLVFRTAITPSKAGKLKLGPVEVPYVALVPRARRNSPRSLFDMFDDGAFGDPFFGEQQQFHARAEAVEIDVKPLPTAGRPPAFSGAVGQFKFSAEGSPRQVKVGDPVTMKLTVSGRGNFDRMEAPALADSDGWRAYPPSTRFNAEDELSTSGSKTFEMAVIPEVKKTAMPVFEFSYFDPAVAKYVTLKSEPAPLAVQGGAPPPPPPVNASSQESAAPTPPAATPQDVNDILGIRYDAGRGRTTFEPLYMRRGFLLAQLVPLAALLAFLATKLRRSDASAGKLAALRQARAALLGKLKRLDLPDTEFLETAARVIQLDTALASGCEPGSVDAATARSVFDLDEDTAELVEKVFADRAEVLYAGTASGAPHLSGPERGRVLATLGKLGKA